MLQRTTISQTLAAPSAPTLPPLSGDLARRLRRNPVGTIVRILSMPLDRTAFAWWTVIMLLFGAGAGVHIWMSIQVATAQAQLLQLQQEHEATELVNAEIMWQISEYTNLAQVQRRAEEMGFKLSFDNRYMPVAADMGPVVLTTEPVVVALPTVNPAGPSGSPAPSQENALLSMPGGGTGGDSASNRLTFDRLGISVERGGWMADLRTRSGAVFSDMNIGLDLLWRDLRTYGEQALKRMAGDFFPSTTTVASN